jgi:MoaA/NifB/PqqE/SkfB family radical SAM enzyme
MTSNLINKISYNIKYIESVDQFLNEIKNKKVKPYQLELQPGRLKGDKICWLTCSYCYGGSAKNTSEKLTPERYIDLLKQTANGPNGGIAKIIFAGYATDPLNYEDIDNLINVSINSNQIIGIHSKLIRASDKLLNLITSRKFKDDYITVSLDASDNLSYNRAHNLNDKVKVYDKVIENLKKLVKLKKEKKSEIDISVNYLITKENSGINSINKSIENLIEIGVDSIRFTFPQSPRGHEHKNNPFLPSLIDKDLIIKVVNKKIEDIKKNNIGVNLTIFDYDTIKQLDEPRSLPCFARFIFPAISYDGYLANCSQSGAVHFRDMSLGNLQKVDFWEAYYNYDVNDLEKFMQEQYSKMNKNDCRCDRKQHTFNSQFKNINLNV